MFAVALFPRPAYHVPIDARSDLDAPSPLADSGDQLRSPRRPTSTRLRTSINVDSDIGQDKLEDNDRRVSQIKRSI